MDANKAKKILDIILGFFFRFLGIAIVGASYWMYYLKQITEDMFLKGIYTAVAIGAVGAVSNLGGLLKLIKRKKDDEPAS